MPAAPTVAAVRRVLEEVTDPEIPVLTIADLGILRDVAVVDGAVLVDVTPTYNGCPAMDAIRADILGVLHDAGWDDVEVRTVLSPAWTTDWMSAAGRQKLEQYGIAPPRHDATEPIRCPRCRSEAPRTVSSFGSTACKALMVCSECGEPFDHFKEL